MHRLLLCISLIIIPCSIHAEDVAPETLSKAIQLLKTGVYEKNKPYVEEACNVLSQHATIIANDARLLKEIENSTKVAQAWEWRNLISYVSASYNRNLHYLAWALVGFSAGVVISATAIIAGGCVGNCDEIDPITVMSTGAIVLGSTTVSTVLGAINYSPKEDTTVTTKQAITALCQRLQAQVWLHKKQTGKKRSLTPSV